MTRQNIDLYPVPDWFLIRSISLEHTTNVGLYENSNLHKNERSDVLENLQNTPKHSHTLNALMREHDCIVKTRMIKNLLQ